MGVDVAGKRIFLSGPMTSIKRYNVPAFVDAHLALLDAGAAHVYDPGVAYLMIDPAEHEVMAHEDYMRLCIHELTDPDEPYDLVVQLPGIDTSRGASFEAAAAQWCGIPTAELDDVLHAGGVAKDNVLKYATVDPNGPITHHDC